MRDTRSLFAHMCHRKETAWDSMPVQEVDDDRMKVLMGLPMRMVEWNTSPMDYFLPNKSNASHGELLVQRVGEDDVQYFYVNTEGYTYARYAFRFEPRAV
ncbi:MAG: hypothetical protein EBZ48_17230 [Proteobacteria bacterium]|nr:hypothetical protein [Pseudomonadota bacterium]